jgi:hypothetical protein
MMQKRNNIDVPSGMSVMSPILSKRLLVSTVKEEVAFEEEIRCSMMKVKSVVVVEFYPKTLSHLSRT